MGICESRWEIIVEISCGQIAVDDNAYPTYNSFNKLHVWRWGDVFYTVRGFYFDRLTFPIILVREACEIKSGF
jgi:hypothetical protein